ncbi:hypothetical protein C3V36_07285 [Lachnospiraceae bacterium oral taxon 500]|nr:hypothetical protein C3V36_07285 [Lachnospiraceae bacterium oral taxon 500]
MKDLQVKGNDLVLENGDFKIISGEDEILQSLERILTTRKGEWFLNEEIGLDYSELEKKEVDQELLRLSVIEAVLQEERVQEVLDLIIEWDRAKRALKLSFNLVLKGKGDLYGGHYEVWL